VQARTSVGLLPSYAEFACDGGWRQPLEDEVRSGKRKACF
jgi:hypothetical protein